MLDTPNADPPHEFFHPDRSRFIETFVPPTGTGTQLYVIAEAPGDQEVKTGQNLIGDTGSLFRQAVTDAGIDINTITMWNAVPFRSYEINYAGRIVNRNPTKEEVKLYRPYVLKDIRKKRPKAILCLGKTAAWVFDIGKEEEDRVYLMRPKVYNFEGIPVYVTYHPSHAWRTGKKDSTPYKDNIRDLKRAYGIIDKTIDVKPNYKVLDVLEWDKVEQIFAEDLTVALDYEASSLNMYHHDYFIGGIALRGETTGICVYVMIYNFWRNEDEFKISDRLRAKIGLWLVSKKLLVFNLQHECAASLNYFNVYLRNVVDVMMMNRTLAQSGGLKDIASRRLGITTWDVEVQEWLSIVNTITKFMRPTYKGRIREEVLYIKDNNCESIEELLSWLRKSKDKSDRITNLVSALEQVDILAKKYFFDRYTLFSKRLFALVIKQTNLDKAAAKYTDVPVEIIAPYAINDVIYTSKLHKELGDEIKNGDMERAFEIYNDLAKLGFEMESSGIAWDDALATRLDVIYKDKAVNSLRSLLMIEEFQKILPSPKRSKKEETTSVPVFECSQDVLEIQTTTELDKLKAYFNPWSNHSNTRERFAKLVVTRRLQFLMMLSEIFRDFQNSEEQCRKDYPILCSQLEFIIAEPDTHERVRMIDLLASSKELGSKINRHPANARGQWRNNDGTTITAPEIRLYLRYEKWALVGLKSELLEEIYNAFTHIAGIDVDDESTWVSEFRYIFLFRTYKKVMKSYTTYIWGDTGRDSVSLINKANVCDVFAPRYPDWVETASEDRIWIKETSFKIATAVTKRCQSGDHTVPAKSELHDLRISRFEDGIRLHWDLSQSEIRVLAKIANDQNLLQKFNEGADIHYFIASQIWGKPESQISDMERRYAKSAVFAVLYGDAPSSFATKFLSGNVKLAKKIFNQLFTMFPNILDYIKKQHRAALEHGKIKTLFNDPIIDLGVPQEALNLRQKDKEELLRDVFSRKVRLDSNMEKDRKARHMLCESFRAAQNYMIQNASSNLAGIGIYNVSKFIRDEGMTARIDCFTHDSADVDIPIVEVLKLISVLPKYVIDDVVQEFGVPIKAEYELGVSGNHMVSLKNTVIEGTILSSDFKSKRAALDALEERLTRFGVKVSITINKEVESLRSMSELFISRGGFSLAFGQKETSVAGKIVLDFADARRL